MRFLITAGPTREPIDPVRFISNRSSGKMGYALARAARAAGHSVVLVSGPVCLPPPEACRLIRVQTAADMLDALRRNLAEADVLVMAAAVADWRPAAPSARKLKKHAMRSFLELEPTPDILQTLADSKQHRLFIGFAAETHHLAAEARRKLAEKHLDLIIANDVSRQDAGFEADTNAVTLFYPDGREESLPLQPKTTLAQTLVRRIEALRL